MTEMNPYYAHPSPVGDVFDVATWSPGKNFGMGLVGIVLATLVGMLAVCVWDPGLLGDYVPGLKDELQRELGKLAKAYPWAIPAIVGAMGVIAYIFLAASVCFVTDAMRSNCYFRAGPGGMSLLLPHGMSLAKLGFGSKMVNLNLPWNQIQRWSITQRKQFGSLSRDAGNLNAHFDLKLRDGRSFHFSLDTFREPARIIYSRIEESHDMTTALMAPANSGASAAPAGSDVRTIAGGDRQYAIQSALEDLLEQPTNGSALLFSDRASGRFVQFLQLNGALLLDLPIQSLRGDERERVGKFFRGLSEQSAASEEYGGAPPKAALSVVTTSRSFQVNFGQHAALAADVTLDVLREQLGADDDFELEIEQF